MTAQINLLRMSGYTVTESGQKSEFIVTDNGKTFTITEGWIICGENKWKWEKGNLVAKMNVLTGKVKAEPKKFDLIYTVGKVQTVHCRNSIYPVCVAMKKELLRSGNFKSGKFEIKPKF